MTEGILGRSYSPSSRSLPSRRVFTRFHAAVLSRRYAHACRRAHSTTKLFKALNAIYAFFVTASLAAMPLRYAVSGFVLAAAGRAQEKRTTWDERIYSASQRLRDAAMVRPWHKVKHRHMRAVTGVLFAAVAVWMFSTLFYSTGLEVMLNGQTIGYVATQDEVELSVAHVADRVSEIIDRPYAFHPDIQYDISSVRTSLIFDQEEFEQQLFASVTDVAQLHVLTLEGQVVGACASAAEIETVLEDILAQYSVTSSYDSVGFVQDMGITFQYTDTQNLRSPDELKALLTSELRPAIHDTWLESDTLDTFCQRNGISAETLQTYNHTVDLTLAQPGQSLLIHSALPYLSVSQNRRISYQTEVAYETEYIESASLFKGETEILTQGVPGEATIVANQMYMDGQVVGETVLAQTVIVEPVAEIIAKGTKVNYSVGTFLRPYGGRLTSPYGYRSMGFHSGIDLAGPVGDEIFASDGGKVVFAGWQGGYGNLVVIEHNSKFTTAYAHNSSIKVKVGQMVAQGDVIALVGSTGRSTGPHLHFEVRVFGKAVNPEIYLKK